MSLDRTDSEMLNTEFKLLGLKLDKLDNHLDQIQENTYQTLLEQVKQTEILKAILLKG